MVVMEQQQQQNISGSPTSQVLYNGMNSIQNGLQNGIQSIQSLPPQMYVFKERIIKNNNYYLLDDQKVQQQMESNGINQNRQDNNDGISYLDNKQNKIIGIKDSEFNNSINNDNNNNNNNININESNDNLTSPTLSTSSSSSFRLRSLSAPGSSSSSSIPGTKNQREMFQASLDTLVAKFNKQNISNNNVNINSTNSTNNSSSIDTSNNISVKSSLNDSGNDQIKRSQGNGSDQECQLNNSEYCEELSNIDEEIKRMRSSSLNSFETIRRIERDRGFYEPRDDTLSPYEMLSHLEYQERIEKEEQEREEKNNIIISQSYQDGYTGNDTTKNDYDNDNSNNNLNSTNINYYHTLPKINISSSSNGSGSSSLRSCFSPTSQLSSSPTRSSPIFKRSLTSNNMITLSKSASKLPIQQQQQSNVEPPLPTQPLSNVQQQQQQQQQQQTKQPQQTQQEQLNNNNGLSPRKVQPLVKSLSSQTIIKLQQQQIQQQQQQILQQQQQIQQLSPNRPSTPQQQSSPNLTSSLKKLSSKLSLSTHSLPQNNNGDSNNTTPSMSSVNSSNNNLVKCPSGNSISIKSSNGKSLHSSFNLNHQHHQKGNSLNSSSNSTMPINNSFQLELKQHLKKKQELNQSIERNERKEKFEQKKITIQKPMDEPSSNASNSIKVTFQFNTGKKISRYFQSDCKVEVLKDYIEWLSVNEPQIFDSSFKLSDDSFYRIVDYDFCFTLLPTKISISNFNVTFKESGFSPKSNLINISIV